MKKLIITVLLILCTVFYTNGQRKIVHLPDLPGYVTLKCDLHIHTVFSDGDVWPTYRIEEAYLTGLDAIAISDHIEYTPHQDYIPVNYNAAWEITQDAANEGNIILIHAAEITRDMPPGHFNALFISDASLLDKDSVSDAIEEAIKQGAFIQWNHPGWKAQQPDGIPRMYSIHQNLIEKGWIHGIEFFNDNEYYPLVMTFCKKYNLAVTGNSDNHGVISEYYKPPEYTNRPMTLVFAEERTSDAIKEALFARRTLVYFKDILAGMEIYARPFFNQCISVGKVFYENDWNKYLEISNNSDITFYLENGVAPAPASITLRANSVTRVAIDKKVKAPLVYDVRNVITGENEVLRVELKY